MIVKKISSILIFALCILTATQGTASELKLATQDFAPFSYKVDGKVSGPAAEIIRLVCDKADVTCSLSIFPWRRAQMMIKAGKIHGIFLIGRNREREKWLRFSLPILKTEYGFFTHDDNPLQFKQTKDISDYTVGVYGPSNTSRSLEKIRDEIGELKIDMRPDDEPGFRKLAYKRVDAVYSNRDVGHAMIKKLNLKGIRYAGSHKNLKYYIGFSKQYTDGKTVDKFNSAFRELYKEGAIQKILSEYDMEPAELE
ncbi:transporter substrate-binding domain-containing protein [Desulfobacterales bacterium HSG2]|nr:transporter substrate-binding domain-containing protein [Desulfobacterales bacterium HSG2]